MGDRYRYARPRSPIYSPARVSLPINISGYSTQQPEHHMHAIPSSRHEFAQGPRTSNPSIAVSGPITTTTYKIAPDTLDRSSSVREGSRNHRSSTLDSYGRPIVPTIVTSGPRHRPVVHSGGARPPSPMNDPYRSSGEEYYTIPGNSGHGHHHHHRYSATMDNADMNRLTRERDSGRLRVGGGREATYNGKKRDYNVVPHRHADTVAADYGDNGYGYTNPRDLVQYDLDNDAPIRHRSRRDSFEGRRARPGSITSYNDIAPRSYDARERGPPPTTRGFDKVYRQAPPAYEWEQPTARMPVASIEPVQRPARVEPFDPIPSEPQRRNSLSRRPVSLYHDREKRQPQRDEYYDVRDDEPRHKERPQRHDRYDDDVEQRGFGVRSERHERSDRGERTERREKGGDRSDWVERRDGERPERLERREKDIERSDRVERRDGERPERLERREKDVERSDRVERRDVERPDKPERKDKDDDKHEHKGRDALTAGLSLAGAALGVKSFKDAGNDNREERDEPRRRRERGYDRDYDEPRRRRDPRDERDSAELSERDLTERRRSSDLKPRGPSDESLDSAKDNKERHEERDNEPERSRRHRPEAPAAISDTAVDSHDGSSGSDDVAPRSRRARLESGPTTAFDPKNTMDLKAMKDALNSQTPTTPTTSKDIVQVKTPTRTPRESVVKDSREVAEIRTSLNQENRAPRIVTPPPQSATSSGPVKGILRQPREKFPEDPAPIREGVAPLKDAKKDGVPPDARWTKISRKLVNPEALEAGKERYEAREDFVIVLRVLSRDEVQQYAEVTETIRAARDQAEEEEERLARRRARRERHERHKRERSERGEREPSHDERRERRRRKNKPKVDDSESDSTESEYDQPKLLESGHPVMSGGLGHGDTPTGLSGGGSKMTGR